MAPPKQVSDLVATYRRKAQALVAAMPWGLKRVLLIAFDIVVLALCVWLSYSIRLGSWLMPSGHQFITMLLAPAIAVPIFARMGLYRAVIRYLPERTLWTISSAVVLATLFWIAAIFILEITRLTLVPRSVALIYAILAIAAVGGSRYAVKYLLWSPPRRGVKPRGVILFGAGQTGAQMAEALQREHSRSVVAFIDDDPSLKNREVAGIRIHPRDELRTIMKDTGTDEVVLCLPAISIAERAEIVAWLTENHARVRMVPAMADIATGRYLVSQIREIDIDDLLGRSAVPADQGLMRGLIEGHTILVSGGGGSIGSELCRLFVNWHPRKLIILEQNEFALYQIDRLLKKVSDITIVPVLGSVTDEALVRRCFAEHDVQIVFHAAAHKHVPMLELNVLEGIRNNVFGAETIARAASEAGVGHFVLISSDKAVRPANVMGATKRAAEMIVRGHALKAAAEGRDQKFSAVRFGNVLGSNGSVVPLFSEQIAAGGPVTLTDENMIRYFMSIHEAAELIVQAGALSEGGDIFVLDMGEPMRIRDLAEHMIRLSGLTIRNAARPDGDIEIVVVGTRPGEKLFEELFYDLGRVSPTIQPKIMRANAFDSAKGNGMPDLGPLAEALAAEDVVLARKRLFNLIDEIVPEADTDHALPLPGGITP